MIRQTGQFFAIVVSILLPVSTLLALQSNNDDIIVERQQIYHLIQLSIDYEADRIAEFNDKVRNLRSCTDARDLALRWPAELRENSNIALYELPTPLQSIVKDLRVGQATRPFGSVQEGVRVLVVCSRRTGSKTSAAPNEQS